MSNLYVICEFCTERLFDCVVFIINEMFTHWPLDLRHEPRSFTWHTCLTWHITIISRLWTALWCCRCQCVRVCVCVCLAGESEIELRHRTPIDNSTTSTAESGTNHCVVIASSWRSVHVQSCSDHQLLLSYSDWTLVLWRLWSQYIHTANDARIGKQWQLFSLRRHHLTALLLPTRRQLTAFKFWHRI